VDERADRERKHDRRKAREEHIAPGIGRIVGEPDARDLVVHRARQQQAERRGRVEDRAGEHASLLRHRFGDQRRAYRPFAADAEARKDAKCDELRHVGRGRAQRGADRIQRHGQEQRAAAAVAIRIPAEEHAADRPAHEQDRGEDAGPQHRRLPGRRAAGHEIEQGRNGIRRDEIEQQGIEHIETPAEPCGREHQPLIARHACRPPSLSAV